MTKYGIDAAYPFSRAQATSIRRLGWSWLGMYVGGPRALAASAWHQHDGLSYPVRDLDDIFDGFLPIYVGRNVGDDPKRPWDGVQSFTREQGMADGADACQLTGACGFDSWTPLVLDVEYNTWEAHPTLTTHYVLGWVEAVNSAGHPAGLYADRATVMAFNDPSVIDFVWTADWRARATGMQHAPLGDFDPSWPPAWDAWQFGGSVIAGVNVDLNSCSDELVLATYG